MTTSPKAEKHTFLLIQVLRAVAALLVVGYHVGSIFRRTNFFNGAGGVDIFFVISGLVMTISSVSLRGNAHPARTFFTRRLERIVPLYWIATTLKLALLFALPNVGKPPGSAWHIVSSYLFLPGLQRGGGYPVLPAGWTLNFEMLFYALFAVALAMGVRPWKLLTPCLIVITVVAFRMPRSGMILQIPGERIMAEFLYGMLLGELLLARKVLSAWLGAVLMAVGFAVLMQMDPEGVQPRMLVLGLPALAIVAGALALEKPLGKCVPRWLLEIGDASYAIYLFHDFVVPAMFLLIVHAHVSVRYQAAVGLVPCLLGSVVVGVAVHRAIELPIMRSFRERRNRGVAANA